MNPLSTGTAVRSSLLAAALLALAPLAQAASTWNFGSGCTEGSTNAGNFGNTWTCTPSGGTTTASASAWATTGSGSVFAAANLAQYGSSSGFGVRDTAEGLNTSSPNHSLDNSGSTDVIALKFDKAVALNQVSLGWSQTDSDISVLRYTGSSAPVIANNSIAGLLSSGWQLVGSYADVTSVATNAGSTTGTVSINAGGLTSSWWIISAYDSRYGGTATGALSDGNDYIKVLTVAGNVVASAVPEPASLSLAGVAVLALVGVSRRSRRT